MNLESLRSLIRSKLEEGLLPYDSIPRIWGAPANGETCDGCDSIIAPSELVMEGISLSGKGFDAADRRRPLQLHVTCFYIWDGERRAASLASCAGRVRTRGARPHKLKISGRTA